MFLHHFSVIKDFGRKHDRETQRESKKKVSGVNSLSLFIIVIK